MLATPAAPAFVAPVSWLARPAVGCRRAQEPHQRAQAQRPRPSLWALQLSNAPIDPEHLKRHLETDLKADLAILAKKFSAMVTSLEGIEEVHVSRVDGDEMALEVVYCNPEDDTCIALDVPIRFPHHCDTEEEVDEVIHELEEMEGLQQQDPAEMALETLRRRQKLSPDLLATIGNIMNVMNDGFQSELSAYARAFSLNVFDESMSIAQCRMIDLSPNGFIVEADMLGGPEPLVRVPVAFRRECGSATDFQQQILELSAHAMQSVGAYQAA